MFANPRTGVPDRDPPLGWDPIPGARGCTPQACAFRDHHAEFGASGASVYGLSTQTTDYQREMVEHLPFAVLSDAELRLAVAIRLPTFKAIGMVLLKRLTMVVADGVIEHVFYPVFPPDANATQVVDWLREHPR